MEGFGLRGIFDKRTFLFVVNAVLKIVSNLE